MFYSVVVVLVSNFATSTVSLAIYFFIKSLKFAQLFFCFFKALTRMALISLELFKLGVPASKAPHTKPGGPPTTPQSPRMSSCATAGPSGRRGRMPLPRPLPQHLPRQPLKIKQFPPVLYPPPGNCPFPVLANLARANCLPGWGGEFRLGKISVDNFCY